MNDKDSPFDELIQAMEDKKNALIHLAKALENITILENSRENSVTGEHYIDLSKETA